MKEWYKSKTIWLNGIAGALATLEASTGILQPFLPDQWYAAALVLLPAANVLLRLITGQPIGKPSA